MWEALALRVSGGGGKPPTDPASVPRGAGQSGARSRCRGLALLRCLALPDIGFAPGMGPLQDFESCSFLLSTYSYKHTTITSAAIKDRVSRYLRQHVVGFPPSHT